MQSTPTRRTVRKTLRLTPEDRTAIERKAHAVGLPVSAYIRALALGRRPRARRRFQDTAGIAQLSRLGNNLLQLRRVAEASGHARVQRDLEATLAELRELLHALMDTFKVESE